MWSIYNYLFPQTQDEEENKMPEVVIEVPPEIKYEYRWIITNILLYEGSWKNGKKEGTQAFYLNDKLISMALFKNGEPISEKEWYPDSDQIKSSYVKRGNDVEHMIYDVNNNVVSDITTFYNTPQHILNQDSIHRFDDPFDFKNMQYIRERFRL